MPTTKKTKAKRMADRQTRSKEAASKRGAKAQGMNAIELLEQDHQEVIGYFDDTSSSKTRARRASSP